MDEDSHNPSDDDDLDLRELFAVLVAHWWLIGVVTAICAILSGYYAFVVATPEYESESVFQMPESGGPSLGNLGGLASLAGRSLPDVGGVNVFDQVQGRDFIVELAAELELNKDPFFNGSLNPPGLKTRLLRWLGLIGEAKAPTKTAVMGEVVGAFRKNVVVSDTANGAFSVITTHTDPVAAAGIANAVVQKILVRHRDKQIKDQRTRVEYLSGELAKAQEDLDRAVERVQEFAIANNMLSVQELMKQSQQLVKMRDRKDEIADNIAELEALRDFLGQAGADAAGLEILLEEKPQLRQRELLLLLGEPGATDEWLALQPVTVSRALATLSTQLVQIERSLESFQREAADTAENAAELAKLERDVKVATATYEVMVEQFKKQALSAGFALSLGTIFETAVPATGASQPKKRLIVALGLIFGLFLSTVLALVLSMRKGSLYSEGAVRNLLGPAVRYYRHRALPSYTGQQIARVLARLRGSGSAELADLAFALNSESQPVLIVPPTRKEATGLALLAASQLAGAESRTVLVDLFAQMPGEGTGEACGAYRLQALETGLDTARPESAEAVRPRAVTRPDFLADLKALMEDYDRVVLLVVPLSQAGYMMGALGPLDPLVLTMARPGRVTSDTLKRLVSLLPEGRRNREGMLVIC